MSLFISEFIRTVGTLPQYYFFRNIFMNTRNTFAVLGMALLMAGCSAPANTDDAMMDDKMDDAMMEDSMNDEAMMNEESSLTFVGGSSVIDHDGGFADFSVEVGNSEDLAGSTLTATINTSSVYTDSNGLTGHLQTEEFFDTENYPEATFVSTEITGDNGGYKVMGDLTIKGVTKPVTMNATLEGNMLTAEFELPRKEFNVGNDSYGDKILDEMVPVQAVVYLQ